MAYEIDPFLASDATGIILGSGDDAWIMRLSEWLGTPAGSIYGAPAWGNPLEQFKHEPLNKDNSHLLEAAIEAVVINKLRDDIPGLGLQGIRCEAISIDQVQFSFMAQGAAYTTSVSLTGGNS